MGRASFEGSKGDWGEIKGGYGIGMGVAMRVTESSTLTENRVIARCFVSFTTIFASILEVYVAFATARRLAASRQFFGELQCQK